jgi:hypothetical protein
LAGKGFTVVAGEVKNLAATIATGEIAATIATVERDGVRPAMAASTGSIGQAATEAAAPPVPSTPPWSSWAPGPQRAPPRREHPYGHRKLPCTCWTRGGRAALHHRPWVLAEVGAAVEVDLTLGDGPRRHALTWPTAGTPTSSACGPRPARRGDTGIRGHVSAILDSPASRAEIGRSTATPQPDIPALC